MIKSILGHESISTTEIYTHDNLFLMHKNLLMKNILNENGEKCLIGSKRKTEPLRRISKNDRKSQWYTNKDLYEMIVKSNDDLKNEISQSNKEMRQEIAQSNKDLREMISSLAVDSSKFRKELDGLTTDLAVTRQEIKTYNNLRSTMNNCMVDLQTVKNEVHEQKNKTGR